MRKTVKIASPYPLYIAAGCIVLLSFIFPLYELWGILLTGALSTAGYFISKRFFPDKEEQIDTVPEYRTGIAELDEALLSASSHLNALRRIHEELADAEVKASVFRMIHAGDAILSELNLNPDKTFSTRKFLTYYLPTSRKLIESYHKQEKLAFGGANSDEIMNTVKRNSETIAKAFESCLDSLYAGEAMDISSDIDVLEGMVGASKQ